MEAASQPLASQPIFLRVTGNFDEDTAWFSYSVDGESFTNIGDSVLMPYQLKTFQGTRYALFAYNSEGKQGGYADFDNFQIDEPLADRSENIPTGKIITLFNRGMIPVYLPTRMVPYTSEAKDPKNMKQKLAVSVCTTVDRDV